MNGARDFSTISPSARALLLVKSQTALPYAREAAELLCGKDAVLRAHEELMTEDGADLRRQHFELRALSIDAALRDVAVTRVLELGAGLSFRGLAIAGERADVHYVDSDLPEMIATKTELAPRLRAAPLAGTLRFAALDALDRDAFRATVRHIPRGPIAVVHEGLLMYLDDAEKAQLAANVRETLRERGGVWITADIYVRTEMTIFRDARTKEFLEKHKVEEQKFANSAAAESFFSAHGFTVVRRVPSSGDPQHSRETWMLTA